MTGMTVTVPTRARLNTFPARWPRLKTFLVWRSGSISGLPKLLLSATHLVVLYLQGVPRSGYIPPEAMATTLSALTSLKSLCLQFRYSRLRPAFESRRPPLPSLTRSILPSLTKFELGGTSEYLEEILARIDTPRINKMM